MEQKNRTFRSEAGGFIWLLLLFLWTGCSLFTEPENKSKQGFTAREAEQLASTRALELMASPLLVSIRTPEGRGGVSRDGRLARGARGSWIFGYYEPGSTAALLIEVTGTQAYAYPTTMDNLPGLQQILPNYIDSSDALRIAEENGGKSLEDVSLILCELSGEAIWPATNPRKVAWKIIYRTSSGNHVTFYIEAYTGQFLSRSG